MSTAMVAGSSGLSAHACWVVGVGVEVKGFLTKIKFILPNQGLLIK
jgi:hypothetical protein